MARSRSVGGGCGRRPGRGRPQLRVRLGRGLPYPGRPGTVGDLAGRWWPVVGRRHRRSAPVTLYPRRCRGGPVPGGGGRSGDHPPPPPSPVPAGTLCWCQGRATGAEHHRHHLRHQTPERARNTDRLGAPAPDRRPQSRRPARRAESSRPGGATTGGSTTGGSASASASCPAKPNRMRIVTELVDERGTSSTCPNLDCRNRVPKPAGRVLSCPHCGFHGHRDLAGAANIANNGGGHILVPQRGEDHAPPSRTTPPRCQPGTA
jgi:hypothetical protein